MLVTKPKKRVQTEGRVNAIMLKDSPEYKAWLDEIANKTRIPMATIVRDAMADYAAKHGLPAPPASLDRRRSR